MGSLSGSFATDDGATPNLTTEGSQDWASWNAASGTPGTYKSSGARAISNVSTITGTYPPTIQQYTGDSRTVSWTDGNSPTSGSSSNGILTSGAYPATGNGFGFTAPADTTSRTLYIYLGSYSAQILLHATLSDSSASAYSDTSLNPAAFSAQAGVYALTYAANSASQTLTVSMTVNTDNGDSGEAGHVSLLAAALSVSSSPAVGSGDMGLLGVGS